MGKNKQLRKRIVGQPKTITRQQQKIQWELDKPTPDMGFVRKWQREIEVARAILRELERRLEK